MNKESELSHNVYSDDTENTFKKLPNYLILIQRTDIDGNPQAELIQSSNLTKAIRIAAKEKTICTIYESITGKGNFATYLCDVSKGIL
nr:MAG TPA: hypothetical protein [Microviridae sp.]